MPRDPFLSKLHCELVFQEGLLRVRDAGSRNGLYLQGQRIFDACLKESSLLRLGQSTLEFKSTTDALPFSVTDHTITLEEVPTLSKTTPQPPDTGDTGSISLPLYTDGQALPIKFLLEQVESAIIEHHLQASDGNVRDASQRLGISERWFYNRIKKYNLRID